MNRFLTWLLIALLPAALLAILVAQPMHCNTDTPDVAVEQAEPTTTVDKAPQAVDTTPEYVQPEEERCSAVDANTIAFAATGSTKTLDENNCIQKEFLDIDDGKTTSKVYTKNQRNALLLWSTVRALRVHNNVTRY